MYHTFLTTSLGILNSPGILTMPQNFDYNSSLDGPASLAGLFTIKDVASVRILKPVGGFIGASLSEPHTRELGGEISVRLLACMYPSDFARELQVKMFACSLWPWQNTQVNKSQVRYREMTIMFFCFFSQFCNVHACASTASAKYSSMHSTSTALQDLYEVRP